ncbi:MAG: sulfotransferase [Rhodanobacter sp.]
MTDPEQLYAQLVSAFRQCKWREAQELIRQLLPFATEHAGVYGIAGMTCLELQQLPEAVAYLQRAAELDPARADFATMLAKALLTSHWFGQARIAADRAMALKPQDPMTLNALGMIYAQTEAHEAAATAFQLAVSLAPTAAAFRFNLATALTAIGDVDGAEREIETCIELNPTSWHAHPLLSQLRKQTSESNHLARLQSLLAKHQNQSAAVICLNMAMAKEAEDLGNYAEAFGHTVQGKAAARATRPYSGQRDKVLFDTLMRAFPESSAETIVGDPSDQPIFIMGMPRSGTTLVERILSSHPDVHAAGELQNFAIALQEESSNGEAFLLDSNLPERTRSIDWKQLGARYLASTLPATANQPRFIDKMPHNFLYAGFIANALPNATIICMRRNPLDTCLGNFRQNFSHPSIHLDYSCDLLDTGRYYILFDRLMAHWQHVFPGRIHEVSYEALVTSPEPISRKLIDHCGLTWNDSCLHFESNPSPVATLSSQQVRQPMYRSSIGRWKHYERELADLRALLQNAGLGGS